MGESNPNAFLPLRQPTFYILLSLVSSEKHGYAILKEVEALSEGSLQLSTGTLYEALSRLLEQGLIERIDAQGGPGPGKPRKTYRLTGTGRQVIEAEAARIATQAAAARRQMGERPWTSSAPSD
jgi:DNA-binding PadR family transcriptional regulator